MDEYSYADEQRNDGREIGEEHEQCAPWMPFDDDFDDIDWMDGED